MGVHLLQCCSSRDELVEIWTAELGGVRRSSVVYTHVTVDAISTWVADLRSGHVIQITNPDGVTDLYPDWGPAPRCRH
jgi:hypothetical protein